MSDQSTAKPVAGLENRMRPGQRFLQAAAKPKNLGPTLGRLWKFFSPEHRTLAIVFSIILIDCAIGLTIPWLIGRAVDAMAGASIQFDRLAWLILFLGLAYVVDLSVGIGQSWLMAGVSQRIVSNLRQAVFNKLQKLPVGFFDATSHGELMSRLTNDVDNVSASIAQSSAQLVSNAIMVTGSLVFMLVLNPLLTLASLITVPLVFWLTRTIARRTSVLFKEQQTVLGQLNGQIEESISGIVVVKAFNHETEVIGQFESTNQALATVGIKAQIWAGFLMPMMNVINNIGFTAVAAIGGILAVGGGISLGTIASFLSYSRQFVRPLNDIANIFNTLQTAIAGAERVFDLLDQAEESPDPPGAFALTAVRGEVEFRDVDFSYGPGAKILDAISFRATAGSSVALVGPTGAGKTTIVNLLARFYEVGKGAILIDGHDIRTCTRDSLRRVFGIVLQDTYLFAGTIRENLRYAKLTASDAEIAQAAGSTGADLFIDRLPQGYDSPLSEGGSSLSQGQRQLLAITRAILADPAILILDEATSNVDTRTELHIQEALQKLMKGRTSFIIAHRLGTIRNADTILVLDGGRIVEQGSHHQLMAAAGLYSRMQAGQFLGT